MREDVVAILEAGVQKKREGDFAEAQRLYSHAIALDPFNAMGYYNLAKTCYLAGTRRSSVINYLRSLHLSLLNQWQNHLKSAGNVALPRLDSEAEAFFRKAHDAAVFLPYQGNITRHLGHALIDLEPAVFQQTHDLVFGDSGSEQTFLAMKHHADQYRSSISGAYVQLTEKVEDNVYGRTALFFSLRAISWPNMIPGTDVREIYPDKMDIPNPYPT